MLFSASKQNDFVRRGRFRRERAGPSGPSPDQQRCGITHCRPRYLCPLLALPHHTVRKMFCRSRRGMRSRCVPHLPQSCTLPDLRDSPRMGSSRSRLSVVHVVGRTDEKRGTRTTSRFVLEYAARVQQGDTRLMMALSQCCTNEASQDAQVLRFCSSFSELVVRHFGPRGMAIDREHINQLLMRTKVNSLGFPYDLERAYGWAMDSTICAVNHSCVPNCVVQCSKGGKMTLATIRDVAEGEELTIAYVTPQDIPNVKDRSRELLEHYRFLCRCTLCEQQRSSGSCSATNTNKADGE